jgi:hypothetical protein
MSKPSEKKTEQLTDWKHAGQVTLNAGNLVFPDADRVPGLYRFTITGSPEAVYVGQAGGRAGLKGRFLQYRRSARRPAIGLDRLTTRRNAHYIRAALQPEAGHTVNVDLITGEGLADKLSRDKLERDLIAKLPSDPGIRVLNRAGYRPVPLA